MTRVTGQMTDEFELPPADPLPIGGTALQCRLGEAAIELFYAHGALATTVRDITGACGLTQGALYNHFASKDHLLYVLVRDIHLLVNEQMDAALAVAGTEPDGQLAAMVRFLVAHTAGHKKRSRMANREFTVLTGERREEVRGLRRQIRDRFTRILLAGAQQGVFDLAGGNDAASATLASATISSMCVHISEWTLELTPTDIADLQDRYVTMALRIAGAKS
jgi:TetR/AcrR family transcriptional regulator, cholesterol catabolism regulator